MRFLAVLLIALLPSACAAQDAHVAQLHDMLAPLRTAEPPIGVQNDFGATETFTAIKAELRDWVETRLSSFAYDGDEYLFTLMLNRQLDSSDLSCRAPATGTGDFACIGAKAELSSRGFLDEVRVSRQNGYLIVRTGVGLDNCGSDQSAYFYTWDKTVWRRVLSIEQDDYRKDAYKPQQFSLISVSEDESEGRRLVLTLSVPPWCTSSWRVVDYGIWRIGPKTDSKQLLFGREEAYIGVDRPIVGGVAVNGHGDGWGDVLIEFYRGSLDFDNAFVFNAVRHFRIEGDRVEQIAPFALGPKNALDEWLFAEPNETGDRLNSGASAKVQAWRRSHRLEPTKGFSTRTSCIAERTPICGRSV